MYLTRMRLNTNLRETIKALDSPNMLHGAVESAFPFSGERKRVLWRIDKLNGNTYLLILSDEKPNLENAARQFGVLGETPPWEHRDYESLLKRVNAGTKWHFRLVANPTCSKVKKSETAPACRRGAVFAHMTVEYQAKWLLDRADAHGFALSEDDFTVTNIRRFAFYKGANRSSPVTILSVTYEGYLTVTDAELFKSLLTTGIGRGKAYGNGLMTVVQHRADGHE